MIENYFDWFLNNSEELSDFRNDFLYTIITIETAPKMELSLFYVFKDLGINLDISDISVKVNSTSSSLSVSDNLKEKLKLYIKEKYPEIIF